MASAIMLWARRSSAVLSNCCGVALAGGGPGRCMGVIGVMGEGAGGCWSREFCWQNSEAAKANGSRNEAIRRTIGFVPELCASMMLPNRWKGKQHLKGAGVGMEAAEALAVACLRRP